MNSYVVSNYLKLKLSLFWLPIFVLLSIVLFLWKYNALNAGAYINIQKDWFYFLNANLSKYSQLQYNITQLGDAFILLSLLTVFLIYAPKIWECLITAAISSVLFSKVLKELFSVPRPASILNHDSFVIIGKALIGPTSSLPSGHSITIFTILTVIMYSLMPAKGFRKMSWFFFFILAGLTVAFSRVAIGAHFPIDVIVGSTIGYICGLIGIFINKKYNLFSWVSSKKRFPVLIAILVGSMVVMVLRITDENLFIYYLSLLSLIFSLYLTIKVYAKKKY